MRIGYFDCFSGASGDMILGACLDAGADLDDLRQDLAGLGVEGYTIEARPVAKRGFAATRFDVDIDPAARPHRRLKDVREIVTASRLPEHVRDRALTIFTRLAEAEADVHGTTIEEVHFHEVGAVDAIVDIVGVCIALEQLGIKQLCCSPIPTGSGTVRCAHGVIPVPAPATAALLKGAPLAECDEPGELTTPTGAAILTTLADDFGAVPAMVLERIGVGAGRREGKNRPNIFRLLVGQAAEVGSGGEEADEVIVLEANLDDVPGEVIGHVYDRLFGAGALDVYTTPIYMKKNRPATQLTVLAAPALRETMEDVIFRETTTFGIRGHRAYRHKLARTVETVQTDAGPIRIKIGRRAGEVVTASPEFEDCRQAANRTGKPLLEVMNLAMRTWRAVLQRAE